MYYLVLFDYAQAKLSIKPANIA